MYDITLKTALLLLITLHVGCSKPPPPTPPPFVDLSDSLTGEEKRIAELITSEDLLLDLTKDLQSIASQLQGDDESVDHFATLDHLTGIAGSPSFHTDQNMPSHVQVASLSVAQLPIGSSPWSAISDMGVKWSTLKFGVLDAEFSNEERTEFTLETKSEARGSGNDELYGLKGHQQLVFAWKKDSWRLSEWIQEDLKLMKSSHQLFRDVLPDVISDPEALDKATRSHKDEIIIDWSKRGQIKLPRMDVTSWAWIGSNHIFPSVSAVDYNTDGYDDLFLTSRWGPTQMLKNNGDGTFDDVTEEVGLSEPYMVNTVLFVDLDNDGDKDAFIGRPMEKARYMRNDDGKFVDVTESHSDLGDQYFVSSITASDVNRDGLLDLYLTSYVPLQSKTVRFEDRFLTEEEREQYNLRVATTDFWVEMSGASNVLLMNRGGGKLERVPYDNLLSQWRRSFQATWADYDNDGDDDLYVCTDFAPNALLRNDTPKGAAQPVFSAADDVFPKDLQGFSMGGSWGDYDSDGDLDLYVSNMYSKAGRRILSRLGTEDGRLIASAAGNFLFENEDGRFSQVAGDGKQAVDKVGWSWGGQWSDFDNDGDLDLYVPSGYHTAPKEIAGVDT
ncbi:FG-GAP repeat domain-containing protein [Mariniblastus fucicola]|uniref:FG-GAP repeat domain-containing protein n=1 Tax=Mariniblastus fucicola TaxID=980251 RepID=UPI00139018EA|nr:VCBS repeat-containing protein [Mariniblastus fucicola]